MLIEAELASGDLVVACNRPLRGERGYYLVSPNAAEQSPLLHAFSQWLFHVAKAT
jgi:DNA-binding transcriptional LysR family regulator